MHFSYKTNQKLARCRTGKTYPHVVFCMSGHLCVQKRRYVSTGNTSGHARTIQCLQSGSTRHYRECKRRRSLSAGASGPLASSTGSRIPHNSGILPQQCSPLTRPAGALIIKPSPTEINLFFYVLRNPGGSVFTAEAGVAMLFATTDNCSSRSRAPV